MEVKLEIVFFSFCQLMGPADLGSPPPRFFALEVSAVGRRSTPSRCELSVSAVACVIQLLLCDRVKNSRL